MPNKMRIYPVLLLGLMAVSTASVLIKFCAAPSLVIATYRLGIAASLYWAIVKFKAIPVWAAFRPGDRRLAFISGLFLTLHFAMWITSLKYTSVASSVVLVQSSPVFVALSSYLILREKIKWPQLLGILLALLGGISISAYDFSTNQSSAIGNLLALGGAIGAAGYILAGRKLRARIDTLPYVTWVYSVTAITLFLITLIIGAPLTGYSLRTYGLFLAIALLPQVIGHTTFNWALKYFSATTVSVILLGEPIGATILALIFLGEQLSWIKILGGLIILGGVLLVILVEAKNPDLPAPTANS
ncbi:DMT family transporter [candidate division KSB1 bacterium]|nr:DMT family transporter [candidate division KSB1 bacterium]